MGALCTRQRKDDRPLPWSHPVAAVPVGGDPLPFGVPNSLPFLTLLPAASPRAVVVVGHGLNMRSAAMDQLCSPLLSGGAAVVRVTWSGHLVDGEPTEALLARWKGITSQDWKADWMVAQGEGAALARRHDIPLTYLGFSLGGLLQTRMLLDSDVRVDRQVLLAPAIRLRWRVHALQGVRRFPGRLVVPSFAPRAIRSHPGTSVAAYSALFGLETSLDVVPVPERLKLPTLVFMDPDDELVSQTRLERWIHQNGLEAWWQVRPVGGERLIPPYTRHYITDGYGLGRERFRAMSARIVSWLIDGLPA